MKKLYFDDGDTFVSSLIEDVKELGNSGYVSVYGYYDEIVNIAESLIKEGIGIAYMEVDSPYDYEGVYILNVDEDGVSIEKAKWEGQKEYKLNCPDYAYIYPVVIQQDCEVLDSIDTGSIYAVYVGEQEENDCSGCPDRFECDMSPHYKQDTSPSVNIDEDDDGNIHGITLSSHEDGKYWSYSFNTTENLDKNNIEKIMDLFMKL